MQPCYLEGVSCIAQPETRWLPEFQQVMDDKSLSLVIRDARDNGRKVLREYYLSKEKPKSDYNNDRVNISNTLGEVISDGLLIPMTLHILNLLQRL